MRSTVKLVALTLMLVALLVPLTSYASGGKCPDDPELSKTCDQEAPPYSVVVNRDFEDLDRLGTGCQPIILDFPECTDCCNDAQDPDCQDATNYVESTVCPILADRADWADSDTIVLYELCCDCGTASGTWMYKVRLLREDGTCGFDPDNQGCYEGLPPGTGIDLPAPLIAGGLAIVGALMLGVGMVVRRRSSAALT